MWAPLLALSTSVCVALLLWAEKRGLARRALAAKSAASLGFVLLGAFAADLEADFDRWLLAGLVCAAIGDVCLALPGERAFLAGVGAFFLGHAAYAVAAHAALASAAPPLWAWSVVAPSSAAYVWLYPSLGAMRVPVAAYVVIITVMVAYALSLLALRGVPALGFALGALLFYASDLSVARDRFVKPSWINKLWGLPAYYAGQLLIAHAAAQL